MTLWNSSRKTLYCFGSWFLDYDISNNLCKCKPTDSFFFSFPALTTKQKKLCKWSFERVLPPLVNRNSQQSPNPTWELRCDSFVHTCVSSRHIQKFVIDKLWWKQELNLLLLGTIFYGKFFFTFNFYIFQAVRALELIQKWELGLSAISYHLVLNWHMFCC